jgi:two-component system, cell cycle sensor histidine kinase and response regulator CckA
MSEDGMAEQAVKPTLGLPPAVILESIAQPIIAFDKQWRYLYVSARAAQALGRSVEELTGKCMWDVFPADTSFREACERAWEEGRPITVELHSVVLDRWVESYIYPFAGGACAQWRDVSERRAALQALSEAVQRLNAHMDNSPLAIVEFDPQFRVTRWSKGAERLFGWAADEMLGAAIPERRWVYEDDVEKVRQVSADMMEGRRPRNLNVNRNYRKDGSVVECEWYNSAIYDGEGRMTSIFSQVLDITERRRNEERLRQAQKLESVGLLAGGIAHDFNNLLTGIMGNASIALEQAGPGAAERIEEVIRSAERAAGLTRQLLAYSGKGQYVVREIDVAKAVSEIADLVQFSIPKSAGLSLAEQRRLPAVRMDPSQLQQVLMNLVINAGEAIGDGNPGQITVGTSMADLEEPLIDAVGEEIAPGRYVCIEVADNGPGIEADKQSRIFDPFFTTKFTGRGLGLAAVTGILRSQKGGITLESEPGRGSTFRVYLPVAHRAEAAREEPPDEGRGTILVVDDEPAVRDFIAAALREQGFRALTAADGRDALTVSTRENGGIDAVVLDLVMPVMDGNELLPKIIALLPDLKILLTSGYSEIEARRLCAAYPGARFIQKPYTAQQIARALEELLAPADWRVAEKE